MATFRPSGISVTLREGLVEGSARSATTLNIDPIITLDGHRLTMADVGDTLWFKLDPGTDNEEIGSCTGITDNTTYYTLTSCTWGYDFYRATGNVTANKKRHVAGGRFIITNDDHHLTTQYVDIDNAQTIAGVKTFGAFPVTPSSAPTADYEVANKKYADDLAIAGSPDMSLTVKGIGEEATAADINAGTQTGGTSAELIVNPKYLKDSEYYTLRPTTDEKAALVGTSGTPSASNKYVTNDDVTEAKTASKIPRRDANSDVLVATTPTAGDGATSKTYVDSQITGIGGNKLLGPGYALATKTYHNFVIPYAYSTNVPSGDFWTVVGDSDFMSQLSHVIHSSVGTDGTKTIITTNAIWGGVTGGSGRALNFDSGKDVIVEFIHQLNAVGAEQIGFGLSESTAPFIDYDDQTVDAACFTISAAGALYAHTSNKGVGHTETEITGITLTNKNVYRIELNPGVDVKYYVNGVLKQTLTTNLPDGANAIKFGFGVQGNSGDNHVMMSTNPQFSIEI